MFVVLFYANFVELYFKRILILNSKLTRILEFILKVKTCKTFLIFLNRFSRSILYEMTFSSAYWMFYTWIPIRVTLKSLIQNIS